jgi:ubiquinone/menaquinone biosynthesis C-methylase UbiE
MAGLKDSDLTQKRYNRVALFYDPFESPVECLRFSKWRALLFNRLQGNQILEVGIGTGKNLPYYPKDIHITSIDISTRMLEHARKRAEGIKIEAELLEMDAQHLEFPDYSFDTVLATFVFCSVPDPILGLKELHRVCKPDGRLLLMEHMRPGNSLLGMIFDILNPMVVRMMGANINRRTMDNIRSAGWEVVYEEKLLSDIVRLIEAKP